MGNTDSLQTAFPLLKKRNPLWNVDCPAIAEPRALPETIHFSQMFKNRSTALSARKNKRLHKCAALFQPFTFFLELKVFTEWVH